MRGGIRIHFAASTATELGCKLLSLSCCNLHGFCIAHHLLLLQVVLLLKMLLLLLLRVIRDIFL